MNSLISTSHSSAATNWRSAVLSGLAPDGGLYLPEQLPDLSSTCLENLCTQTLQKIAAELAISLLGQEIPQEIVADIASTAFAIKVPLIRLSDNIFCLELFHGPTAAFKDFGARFMAGVLEYFARDLQRRLIVLTATSGDTGSAVANGFYKKPRIEVVILYPSKKVSFIQEQQMTTLGHNIHALEVDGCFDDCQRLVKQAFLDEHLKEQLLLTSANSINIARLIPQSFYYFHAYAQLRQQYNLFSSPAFAVPSGNLGNLCAGVIAKRMGLPTTKFIAALNANQPFSDYLKTGRFCPRPSVSTLSNAMDVGNPSNLARIIYLYQNNIELVRNDIVALSSNDQQTITAIKEAYHQHQYLLDPHSTVGYIALRHYLNDNPDQKGILLATADPGKFGDTVEKACGLSPTMPESLRKTIGLPKTSYQLANNYQELRQFLEKLS